MKTFFIALAAFICGGSLGFLFHGLLSFMREGSRLRFLKEKIRSLVAASDHLTSAQMLDRLHELNETCKNI